MSLPLQTDIDSQNYDETLLQLMAEFLGEFFNVGSGFDAAIEIVERSLDNPLPKPEIHLAISGGAARRLGGIALTDLERKELLGEYKELTWSIRIITDDASGGALVLSRYAGHLDHVFRSQTHHMAPKGLRKARLSAPINVNVDSFYQKMFTLTNQLLLSWEIADG